MTASVVGAIAPRLEQAEIERAKRKPTESLDAYDYYLRGMAAVHRWTREGNDEALARISCGPSNSTRICFRLWHGGALLRAAQGGRLDG